MSGMAATGIVRSSGDRPTRSISNVSFTMKARVGVNESYFAAVNIVTRWRVGGSRARGVC